MLPVIQWSGSIARYYSCLINFGELNPIVKVSVVKTKRCSGEGELAVDALSKGDWVKTRLYIPDKNIEPEFVPRVLLRWLNNPVPDLDLGQKALSEMSTFTKVLHLD